MIPNKPTSVKLLPTAISKIDHKIVGNFKWDIYENNFASSEMLYKWHFDSLDWLWYKIWDPLCKLSWISLMEYGSIPEGTRSYKTTQHFEKSSTQRFVADFCSSVAKSYLTLLWPHSFSVGDVAQARIVQWIAISFSRRSSDLGIELVFPAWRADSTTDWAT